jgi:DNA-binding Lrp family transcriptional regulator
MNIGRYLLARFSDSEKLLPAVTNLKTCEQVQRWDAVEGHVNLIIKLKSPAGALPEIIKKFDGLDELFSYDILADSEVNADFDPKYSYSYIFIESESAKIEKIRASLHATDGILFASSVRGGCDIVAIVKGDTFSSVDRIVNEKIRILDGILRIKVDRIIDLRQI